jgi:hypothetical protein
MQTRLIKNKGCCNLCINDYFDWQMRHKEIGPKTFPEQLDTPSIFTVSCGLLEIATNKGGDGYHAFEVI